MKTINKILTTLVLMTVLFIGVSFANTGIIVNGVNSTVEEDPCFIDNEKVTVKTDLTGIIVNGITGIIVNGITGIIVNGVVDEKAECGIIVNG